MVQDTYEDSETVERRVGGGGFTSGTCFKPLNGDAQADRRGQAGVSWTMIIF